MAFEMRLYNHYTSATELAMAFRRKCKNDERSSHDGKVYGMAWLVKVTQVFDRRNFASPLYIKLYSSAFLIPRVLLGYLST